MNGRLAGEIARTYADFERVELTARDGVKLTAYACGRAGAPAVLLVNPIGVPVVIASRLMRRLGEQYRVLCWEQRGFGAGQQLLQDEKCSYSIHVTDLQDVAEFALENVVAAVGICSGAAQAISAVARGLVRPRALLLVCPAVRFRTHYVPSLFDSAFVPYMRMINGGNEPLAQTLLDLHASYTRAPRGRMPDLDEQIVEAADTVSLQSLEGLRAYARTLHSFTDAVLDEEISRVEQHVAIFATVDDRTVSIHSVRRLCEMLPDATLREYESGGHFAVFTRSDLREAIAAEIGSQLARVT